MEIHNRTLLGSDYVLRGSYIHTTVHTSAAHAVLLRNAAFHQLFSRGGGFPPRTVAELHSLSAGEKSLSTFT